MTSHDPDQLGPEETQATVADQPTTRGNIREDFNLDGSPQTALATHGSFTRYLARLAKRMFTQQRPYRATEEGDHLDPDTLGDPPGNIKATHGNLTQPMAAHGDHLRRIIMAFQGPTEAVEDLPYLLKFKGYIAEVTSGITKEITANSQDPNRTINHSGPAYWSYEGTTLENYHSPHLPPLTLFSRYLFSPHLLPTQHIFTTLFSPSAHQLTSCHIHHQTPSFIMTYHLPYSAHHSYFANPPLLSPTAIISWHHHFPYFHLIIINLEITSPLHDYLQRLFSSMSNG